MGNLHSIDIFLVADHRTLIKILNSKKLRMQNRKKPPISHSG